MIRIILIGYMGAGKTTVGKALAQELKIPFYDLDWYIEERYRKTIPQIFALQGEAAFRDIESAVLAEISAKQNTCTLRTKQTFMARHRNIFRAESAKVNRNTSGGLRCINQKRNAFPFAEFCDLPNRQNVTKDIGNMTDDRRFCSRKFFTKNLHRCIRFK